jgi:hypothetical protein
MSIQTAKEKVTDATLKVGWWVALVLKPDAAPSRSYAGRIQAIDERGLRITLIDWFTGMAARFDLYVPLASLESALVATPDHDVRASERPPLSGNNRWKGQKRKSRRTDVGIDIPAAARFWTDAT